MYYHLLANLSMRVVPRIISSLSKMLRDENTLVVKILEELEIIKLDEEKINYLYYEWFNKEAATNAYTLLVKSIKKDYTEKHREFYSLLNMLTVKK